MKRERNRRNSRWASGAARRNSRQRFFTSRQWQIEAVAERRVFGIRGPVARAISYALDWYQRVCDMKNDCIRSENGQIQAAICDGKFVILSVEWGKKAPSWLISKAKHYFRLANVRVDGRIHCFIQRTLRRAYWRWHKSQRNAAHFRQRGRFAQAG